VIGAAVGPMETVAIGSYRNSKRKCKVHGRSVGGGEGGGLQRREKRENE
jgi:hypothetical protein